MNRTKLGMLGLCAIVVGIMAMSDGSAQAALSWLILDENGTALDAAKLLGVLTSEADSTHLTLETKVAGLPVAITCTNLALNKVHLEKEGLLAAGGKVTFTGCAVYKAAPLTEKYECSVSNPGGTAGTVETNDFKSELVLVGTKLRIKAEPLTGPTGNFFVLQFTGPNCVLPELNQKHGTLYLKDGEGLETGHLVRHLFEMDPELTAMYVGKHSAEQLALTKALGSAWVKLTGAHAGLKWGAMDA
jgi:hypothetical protein